MNNMRFRGLSSREHIVTGRNLRICELKIMPRFFVGSAAS